MSLYPSPNYVDPNAHYHNATGTDALGQPTTARTMTARDWIQFVVFLVFTGAAIVFAAHLTHKER